MSPSVNRLVLATRGSRLALRQAEIVSDLIRSAHPDIDVELLQVSTRGDRDQRSFPAIGGKGLFVAEIERALVDERADIAVHSAKDLTSNLAEGCAIVGVTARGPVHDVVVGGSGTTGEERLAGLAEGARVGTSSMRRRALLAEARPDLEAVDFRGNVDTRLAKVARGDVDAAVLAAAGIERLGTSEDPAVAPLEPQSWVPAPGQGALAVEALAARTDIEELFDGLTDEVALAEITCERAFAATLEGGCSVPLGCWAQSSDRRLVVTGFLGHPDGGHAIRDRVSGSIDEAEGLGRELAQAIADAGGSDILDEVREALPHDVPAP